MDKLIESEVQREYERLYEPLVAQFCKDVESIVDTYKPFPLTDANGNPLTDENGKKIPGHNRVPAPFLPIIGSGYYEAPIRVAIYGMETYCWHDLYRFVHKFKDSNGSLTAVKAYTDGVVNNPDAYKNRFHEHHGVNYWKERKNAFGFWTFAYSTLACIYGTSEKKLRNNQGNLLSSFIWGNVNAYEKYDASPKAKGMSEEDWDKVFKASKPFNKAQLLLPYTRPHIMVVFYGIDTKRFLKWLTGDKKQQDVEQVSIDWKKFSQDKKLDEGLLQMLTENIHCYKYAGTYVLHTLHPGNMRYRKGSKAKNWKAAINFVVQEIKDKNMEFSPLC